MKKLLFIIYFSFITFFCSSQSYQWKPIIPGIYCNDTGNWQTYNVRFMTVDTLRDIIWMLGGFQGGDTIVSPDMIGYDGKNFIDISSNDTSIGMSVDMKAIGMYNGKIIRVGIGGASSYDVDSFQVANVALFPAGQIGYCITEYNGDLIIGGQFSAIKKFGGNWVGANSIARWDGNNWHAMGMGLWDSWGGIPSVHTMEVYHNKLYVGGNFREAGNTTAWGIASWDGSNWACLCNSSTGKYGIADEPPQNHCCGRVNDMEVFNDKLYVVGEFDSICAFKTHLGFWNDTLWTGSTYPYEFNYQIKTFNNKLVITSGDVLPQIFYWDDNSAIDVDSGLNHTNPALVVFHDTLYAGGGFTLAGNTSLFDFARLLYDSTNVGVKILNNEVIKLNVFPNPTNNEVKITYNLRGASKTTIGFFDVLGREIIKKEVLTHDGTNTEIISLKNLPQGVYLCEVKSKDERATIRIVKE